jgi:hypothetical protein
MGKELTCEARFAGKTSAGKALLETDELIFRGDFRLKIPLKSIQSVETVDGSLRVRSPDGTAVFDLGPQAEKWAHQILHPRGLTDKLDVKAGMRVTLCGVTDDAFREKLLARTTAVFEAQPARDSSLIFLSAETDNDLAKIKALSGFLKRDGALWVVYPKGKKEITENGVLDAGRKAGLVDVKVARFSETCTALKFVIPVCQR